MPTWETSGDWGNLVNEENVAHENITNTDHTDASTVTRGFRYDGSPSLISDAVAWWPLHEQTMNAASDLSGNNNHGSLIGGITQGAIGRYGLTSYLFNGSDSRVEIADSSALDLQNNFTITAWIRHRGSGSEQNYITKEDAYELAVDPTNNELKWALYTSGGWEWHTSNIAISPNEWHFVAFTYDGNEGRFYVDGSGTTWADTDPEGGDIGTNSNAVWIGARANNSGSSFFNGHISNVRLYDQLLSTSQIDTLYGWGFDDIIQERVDGVSHWTLDGDPTDAWGSNDGTSNGETYTNDAIRGQSAEFISSNNEHIDLGNLGIGNSSFTWSTWVKSTNSSQSDPVMGRYDGSTDVFQMWHYDTNSYSWRFGHVGGNEHNMEFSANTTMWNHIVLTHDFANGQSTVYLNGDPVIESNAAIADFTSSESVFLGGRDGSTRYFDGKVGDTRYYNFILEPDEVHDLYQWGTRGRDLRAWMVIQ